MVTASSSIAELIAHCGALLDSQQPLLWALFLGGLTGSISHCTTMCSPFVLAQLDGRQTKASSLLVPYHLGRMTTYMMLGAMAGGAFSLLVNYSWFAVLGKFMLALAGMCFLFALLYRLPLSLPKPAFMHQLCDATQLNKLASIHSRWARYRLGVMLGFIPCGLVFAALMAVAASGSVLTGAAGMALFAIGTMPALMLVGIAGRQLRTHYSRVYSFVSVFALTANVILLFAMAGGWLWV